MMKLIRRLFGRNKFKFDINRPYDLSELPEDEKQKFVDFFSEQAGRLLLHAFVSLGSTTHIRFSVVNKSDDALFECFFIKHEGGSKRTLITQALTLELTRIADEQKGNSPKASLA